MNLFYRKMARWMNFQPKKYFYESVMARWGREKGPWVDRREEGCGTQGQSE